MSTSLWLLIAVLLAAPALVLVPYVWSRLLAPLRSVRLVRRGAARGAREAGALRIVTYNVAHLRGLPDDNWRPTRAERDQRATEIAALLRALDADVVVLNEIDFDASWSGRVNSAQLVAERAGYPLVVEQRNLDFRAGWLTWRFGNAILSRVELRDARRVALPGFRAIETVAAGKKRGVVVTLALPEGDVRLAAVHLCHRSEDVRAAGARALDAMAAAGPPLIVAGDLNAAPPGFPFAERTRDGASAFAVLDGSGRFQRSPSGVKPAAEDLTFPSSSPSQVLDWILIPPGFRFESRRAVHSLLSDHLPVVADVVRAGPL